MSKESQIIDPAGRCVHDRIERVGTDVGYTNQWLCRDCREEFYHLDWKANSGKITVMEPYKTLRDEFAMESLNGMLSACKGIIGTKDIRMATKLAYRLADGMMEARK